MAPIAPLARPTLVCRITAAGSAGGEEVAVRHRHRHVLVRHDDRQRQRRPVRLALRQPLDDRREVGAGVDEDTVTPSRCKRRKIAAPAVTGSPSLTGPDHNRVATGTFAHGRRPSPPLRNGAHGYGLVTKTLHWAMVLAILTQFVIGYTMDAGESGRGRGRGRGEGSGHGRGRGGGYDPFGSDDC